jgi:hypothetical protein
LRLDVFHVLCELRALGTVDCHRDRPIRRLKPGDFDSGAPTKAPWRDAGAHPRQAGITHPELRLSHDGGGRSPFSRRSMMTDSFICSSRRTAAL